MGGGGGGGGGGEGTAGANGGKLHSNSPFMKPIYADPHPLNFPLACVQLLGLSRLCSATFEQLLAFGATFCGFSNLEQVLPFRAIFEQNIGLEHIIYRFRQA